MKCLFPSLSDWSRLLVFIVILLNFNISSIWFVWLNNLLIFHTIGIFYFKINKISKDLGFTFMRIHCDSLKCLSSDKIPDRIVERIKAFDSKHLSILIPLFKDIFVDVFNNRNYLWCQWVCLLCVFNPVISPHWHKPRYL